MTVDAQSAEIFYQGLEQTVQAWAKSLEVGGREPEGHTYRVAELSLRLAKKVGMPHTELNDLVRGALLHDIGKVGVPDSILLKPGKLEPTERALIEQHPMIARQLLTPVEILRNAIDIPYCHHERWDGKGYPRGLKGTQIPLAARIFAVVDVYDSLTIDQPYRAAWTHERALEHIEASAGTHFDPDIVPQFVMVVNGLATEAGIGHEQKISPIEQLRV